MNGVTYERLRGKVGPQLPCPDIGHPGTSRLYIDHQFPRPDGRAALLARKYIEPDDTTNEKYPLVLITGRLPWHFNTRTRTGRVPILNAMEPDNFVEVNPRDAACLDLNENDNVEIKSRRDSVLAKVRIKDRILKGTIYMNMHYGKSLGIGDRKSVNLVTNPAYDINSKQPELKYCAVNILKISI
ncbi:MAG: molybdopterin oxidoreductase family protein [Candidatus Scalindua sp.]|nr:molybdopterin oxidoreductase family protein [Candidatus Scalindua sp.]